jgi:phosphoribosyl 1,2-cyclic phosphodiesterase
VYANALTAERLRQQGKGPERMTIFSNGTGFPLGPFVIEAFSVSHDAIDPVGFVLRCGARRVAIATDFGHAGMMVPLKLHDCDAIVLESNHEPELLRQSGRPPQLQQRILGRRGHLSNQAAGELVPRVLGPATRHLVMAHLSRDCNRPELVRQTVTTCLRDAGRTDIVLHIARQDEALPVIVLPA